ncbi:MAG: NAD-dependent epimerase/dehydratase family protein [Candidatus Competibacteraceae bacterium]|jgi:nucleoside-diphosphate-sugar epimerase|nr:NAD-dependent epimerase/dehydratase family protein [Candidatus Competibacteraceae bacterium]
MTDKILVTGATGFIGGQLAEILVEPGQDVRNTCQGNPFQKHPVNQVIIAENSFFVFLRLSLPDHALL